jgi:hypothetical protein
VRGRLLNYALYQAGWLACVLGAANGRAWSGMIIALVLLGLHLLLVRDRREELQLLVTAGAIGFVADTLQQSIGVFRFPSGYVLAWAVPPWIVVMWVQFASTFRYCMSWLMKSPRLAALFGAIGGPLAFWIGSRLGGVTFGARPWLSLLSIAVVWSTALPLMAWLMRRRGATASSYTWPAQTRVELDRP